MAQAAAGRFRELDPGNRGTLFEGGIATVLASYRDYHDAFGEMSRSTTGRRRKRGRRRSSSRCYAMVSRSRPVPRRPRPGLKRRILTYTGRRRMRTPDDIDIWRLFDLLEVLNRIGCGNDYSSGGSVPITSISSAMGSTGLSSSAVSSMGS